MTQRRSFLCALCAWLLWLPVWQARAAHQADTLKAEATFYYRLGKKIRIEFPGQAAVVYRIPGALIDYGPLKRIYLPYPGLKPGDTMTVRVTVTGLFYRHVQSYIIEYFPGQVIVFDNRYQYITCRESDDWVRLFSSGRHCLMCWVRQLQAEKAHKHKARAGK